MVDSDQKVILCVPMRTVGPYANCTELFKVKGEIVCIGCDFINGYFSKGKLRIST